MRSALAGLLLCAASACRALPPAIVLSTTTSVANSGLLDRLLPEYRQQTGVDVRVAAVGSGRALKMLEGAQADVAITHAPAQEAAALELHPEWIYRKILYNRFVVVGPLDDPARAASAGSAAEAMRRIAAAPVRFISRGDESGTHERERQLWATARTRPHPGNLVIAGAGMGDTLRIASETAAYTLTDEGTLAQLASRLRLRVVSQGDPVLLNTYAVVVPSNSSGRHFADWLASGSGRKRMAALFESRTLRGFVLWPSNKPGVHPTDLPD